jgi:hypothetical protein
MKGAGRRRARRPGAVVLALLVGTTAAGLALTLLYHLGVPGLAVTVLLGLPALYLGWVALQDARRPPDRSLAQIADELAARLRSQWEREAEARGLNDPYPLPVSWTAADPPLAGYLDALKTLATSGAGYSSAARENWARGPEDLAGGGDRKLAEVLARVPTRRLVVLGEPGTGKTMLMVGLVLDLLHPGRRSSGGPVPVLASLASWDPGSQDLHGWLGATVITGYPDLAAAPPPGSAGVNRFEALVEAGLILPVLDGLDEISETARPAAITRINKELKPGEQAVVTCRTEQYRAAVSPQHGQGAVLRAAAVQLSALQFGEVASYLRTDAGPAEGRWDFLDTLSTGSPARQALATPLMAGLARAIYNPRPGEHAGKLQDPSELCGLAARPAVEAHLFDEFIAASYRSPTGGRWTAEQAEKWLVFLARHLEYTIGSPDLAWWQLRKAAPRSVLKLAAGLAAGLLAGLAAGLGAGLAAGLGAGLAFGLGAGLGVGLGARLAVGLGAGLGAGPVGRLLPARGTEIDVTGVGVGLLFGFVVGPLFGFAARLGRPGGLKSGLAAGLGAGLAAGLVAGLGVGLLAGLEVGLTVVPGDLAGVASPRAVLARDRQAALLFMLEVGLVAGLGIGLGAGLASGLGVALGVGLGAGLAFGLVAGPAVSMNETAWPSYMLTRGWLALHHRLPWPLMSFIDDAHQRGVLRQAGAVYQFRHIELQHRLATRL